MTKKCGVEGTFLTHAKMGPKWWSLSCGGRCSWSWDGLIAQVEASPPPTLAQPTIS